MDRIREIKRQVKLDWQRIGYQRALDLLEEEFALRQQMNWLPDQMQGFKLALNILKLSPITADMRG